MWPVLLLVALLHPRSLGLLASGVLRWLGAPASVGRVQLWSLSLADVAAGPDVRAGWIALRFRRGAKPVRVVVSGLRINTSPSGAAKPAEQPPLPKAAWALRLVTFELRSATMASTEAGETLTATVERAQVHVTPLLLPSPRVQIAAEVALAVSHSCGPRMETAAASVSAVALSSGVLARVEVHAGAPVVASAAPGEVARTLAWLAAVDAAAPPPPDAEEALRAARVAPERALRLAAGVVELRAGEWALSASDVELSASLSLQDGDWQAALDASARGVAAGAGRDCAQAERVACVVRASAPADTPTPLKPKALARAASEGGTAVFSVTRPRLRVDAATAAAARAAHAEAFAAESGSEGLWDTLRQHSAIAVSLEATEAEAELEGGAATAECAALRVDFGADDTVVSADAAAASASTSKSAEALAVPVQVLAAATLEAVLGGASAMLRGDGVRVRLCDELRAAMATLRSLQAGNDDDGDQEWDVLLGDFALDCCHTTLAAGGLHVRRQGAGRRTTQMSDVAVRHAAFGELLAVDQAEIESRPGRSDVDLGALRAAWAPDSHEMLLAELAEFRRLSGDEDEDDDDDRTHVVCASADLSLRFSERATALVQLAELAWGPETWQLGRGEARFAGSAEPVCVVERWLARGSHIGAESLALAAPADLALGPLLADVELQVAALSTDDPGREPKTTTVSLARWQLALETDKLVAGGQQVSVELAPPATRDPAELDASASPPAVRNVRAAQLSLSTQNFEATVGGLPLPLATAERASLSGLVIVAAADECLRPVRVRGRDVPVPQVPAKLYVDAAVSVSGASLAHGPRLVEAVDAAADAFTRAAPPPAFELAEPLPWWDQLRYRVHGRLQVDVAASALLLAPERADRAACIRVEVASASIGSSAGAVRLAAGGVRALLPTTGAVWQELLALPQLAVDAALQWTAAEPDHHAAARRLAPGVEAFRAQALALELDVTLSSSSSSAVAVAVDGRPALCVRWDLVPWLHRAVLLLQGMGGPSLGELATALHLGVAVDGLAVLSWAQPHAAEALLVSSELVTAALDLSRPAAGGPEVPWEANSVHSTWTDTRAFQLFVPAPGAMCVRSAPGPVGPCHPFEACRREDFFLAWSSLVVAAGVDPALVSVGAAHYERRDAVHRDSAAEPFRPSLFTFARNHAMLDPARPVPRPSLGSRSPARSRASSSLPRVPESEAEDSITCADMKLLWTLGVRDSLFDAGAVALQAISLARSAEADLGRSSPAPAPSPSPAPPVRPTHRRRISHTRRPSSSSSAGAGSDLLGLLLKSQDDSAPSLLSKRRQRKRPAQRRGTNVPGLLGLARSGSMDVPEESTEEEDEGEQADIVLVEITYRVKFVSPQLSFVHESDTGGGSCLVIAAATAELEGRRHFQCDAKREVRFYMDHVQALVAPTDVDVEASIQWLPESTVLQQIVREFAINSSYVYYTGPPDASPPEDTDEEGEGKEQEQDKTKTDRVNSFFLDVPDFVMEANSTQFHLLLTVARHVLLAPPTQRAASPRRGSAGRGRPAHGASGRRRGLTQTELGARSHILSRNDRLLVAGLVEDALRERVRAATSRLKEVAYYAGRGTWRMARPGGRAFVEVGILGLSGKHVFNADESAATTFSVRHMWAHNLQPSAVWAAWDDSVGILRAALPERGPCARCNAPFSLDDNPADACAFHSNELGELGEFAVPRNALGEPLPGGQKRWLCCGATWEGAPGCAHRPHTPAETMLLVRATSSAPLALVGRKVPILDHFEITCFPGTPYSLEVQFTDDLYEGLFGYFFPGSTSSSSSSSAVDDATVSYAGLGGGAGRPQSARLGHRRRTSRTLEDLQQQPAASSSSGCSHEFEAFSLSVAQCAQCNKLMTGVGKGGGCRCVRCKMTACRECAVNVLGSHDKSFIYFRYIRVGELRIRLRSAGFVVNVDSYEATLRPFVAQAKFWTWQKFLHKVEAHVKWHLSRSTAKSGLKVVKAKLFSSSSPPPGSGSPGADGAAAGGAGAAGGGGRARSLSPKPAGASKARLLFGRGARG